MKVKYLLLFFLSSAGIVAQTTVQFSEPNQFFDVSNGFLKVKILVNNRAEYKSEEPIILEIFSDLEDVSAVGITPTQVMDKVIVPKSYPAAGEDLQLPVNWEALQAHKSFSLYIRKKGVNKNFEIIQGVHTVILNKSAVNKSYVSIVSALNETSKTDFAGKDKIDLPFKIQTNGYYIPVEGDNTLAKVTIKGMEDGEATAVFPMAGAESAHTFTVEKKKNPELYKKLMGLLNSKQPIELEISEITRPPQHAIEINPLGRSTYYSTQKPESMLTGLFAADRFATEEKKVDSLDTRYSFFAGVNFDFNNNFKFEEAYYEMDVSLYNLFRNQWGLRAGIYKTNNSRSLEESFRYEWVNNELVEHNSQDIIYKRRVLDVVANVSTESLGFYFQVPYKVVEAGYFRAFISPHIELIKRIEKYTYEVVSEGTEETVIVPVTDPVTSLKYAPTWLENTIQYWDSYLGVGFPMLYRDTDKGFEVYISPILGTGYPRKSTDSVLFGTTDGAGLSFFSAFQFYLSISAKETLGIKLGSDVRKYFYGDQKPIVSVNIATMLDLSGIMSLTGAN